MKWTQEQRDKACIYLATVADVRKSCLSDHNLDAVIDIACQRNELLEALKKVRDLDKRLCGFDGETYAECLMPVVNGAIAKAEAL